MAVETATNISQLVPTSPAGADPISEGAPHIRVVKAAVQGTFPNVAGTVTPTHTELNYVDGVTSAIQTQLDATVKLTGVQTIAGVKTFGEFTWHTLAGSSGNNAAREMLGFSDDRTDRYGSIGPWRGAASTRVGLSFFCSYDAAPVEKLRLDELGNLRVLGGDFHLSGTMQSGSVPWARLTSVPSYLLLSGGTMTGNITRSGKGVHLYHNSSSHASGAITVSTAAPSGGANGDIWLKV